MNARRGGRGTSPGRWRSAARRGVDVLRSVQGRVRRSGGRPPSQRRPLYRNGDSGTVQQEHTDGDVAPSAQATRATATARHGAIDIMPLAIGVVPYATVVGVLVRDYDFGVAAALFFSASVYAGASQIAAIELMATSTPWVIIVITMLTVNARFALYSAAMWQVLAHRPLSQRLFGSYLLTDQAFVLTVTQKRLPPSELWRYYLGAAWMIWIGWQLGTVIGVSIGDVLPDWVPIGMALPLALMVMLANHARTAPTVATAAVAAVVALPARGLPAGTGLLVAVAVGVAAGLAVERRQHPTRRGHS